MKAKFRTTRPNSKIILKDGTPINFVGVFATLVDETYISEIRQELKKGAYGNSVSEVPEDSPEFEDPVEVIKKQAIAEFLSAQDKSASLSPAELLLSAKAEQQIEQAQEKAVGAKQIIPGTK